MEKSRRVSRVGNRAAPEIEQKVLDYAQRGRYGVSHHGGDDLYLQSQRRGGLGIWPVLRCIEYRPKLGG